ncbi:GNAT family N-acetyltransferase [Spongisporangium articulatum]|uniref:GNAT family N-acetyltransferase n=1 Tax=Spongisporangium articulatum TaxID=3362603 RepID=A0ABW8ASG6_9ACTN
MEPATADRFDDVTTMLAPKKPAAVGCWCLSYRLEPRENQSLGPRERRDRMRALCGEAVSPGVLAYDAGGDVVGWAGVAPRSQLYTFEHSTKIPHVDDVQAWSLWCLKVRAGHRGQGVARALIAGAVDYAIAQGAPVVESYPVDNRGAKVDTTMAFVGTRAMFEAAGFRVVADTSSTLAGHPRVVMRSA